jgi:hypothetical protein
MSYQEHDKCRGCGANVWGIDPAGRDLTWKAMHNEANCLAGKLDSSEKIVEAYGHAMIALREAIGIDAYAEHEDTIETIRRIRGRENTLDVRVQELECRLDELSKAHSDACSIAQDYLRKATTAEMERDAALSRNAAPTQPVDQEDVIVNAMRDGLKGADPDGGYVSDLDRYNGRTIIDGEFDLRLVARTILAKINSSAVETSVPKSPVGDFFRKLGE